MGPTFAVLAVVVVVVLDPFLVRFPLLLLLTVVGVDDVIEPDRLNDIGESDLRVSVFFLAL